MNTDAGYRGYWDSPLSGGPKKRVVKTCYMTLHNGSYHGNGVLSMKSDQIDSTLAKKSFLKTDIGLLEAVPGEGVLHRASLHRAAPRCSHFKELPLNAKKYVLRTAEAVARVPTSLTGLTGQLNRLKRLNRLNVHRT